jgi:hypothetical protein
MTTQYAPPVAPERFAHIKATDSHRKAAFAWLLHHNQNAPTRNQVELMAQCMAEQERISAGLGKVQA